MSLTELAEQIEKRFTPMAFTCPCNGSTSSCAEGRRDPQLVAQRQIVQAIASYVRSIQVQP